MPRQIKSTVSVIIPNYNHAQYVGDAIRSVLAQTYRDYEIILVDDGSTDNSRDVVTQFENQVNCIFQKNAGLSAARNTGFNASRGSLIGFLDADDMYEPDFLGAMVSSLKETPDAAGVYCGYQFVDHLNNPLPQIEVRSVDPVQLYSTLLDGNFLVPESIFLRRSVYDDVGLFDEALSACEDWDAWLRATKKYKIIHSTRILTRHRILPGSMSTDPLRMLNNRLAVLKKHMGEEQKTSGKSKLHRAYGRAYLGSCIEYQQYGNPERTYYCFQKMANLCPDLLTEIDTFYQLGCSDQPKGWMGDLQSLNVERNSLLLLSMIISLIADSATTDHVKNMHRVIYSTAYYSLGILAYNTQEFATARRFISRAIWNDPKLLWNKRILGMWIKTLFGSKVLSLLKSGRQRLVPS